MIARYRNQPISDPIVIDVVVCAGNEQRLSDCYLSKHDGISSCTHNNDVGVYCSEYCLLYEQFRSSCLVFVQTTDS